MAVYTINLDTMMDELASRLQTARPSKGFPDADMKRWINLGMIEFAKKTNLVTVVKFLYLSANIGRYTCPSDWLRGRTYQLLYLQNGNLSGTQYPIKVIDRRGMQALMPTIQDTFLAGESYSKPATGYPKLALLDGNVIELAPIPNSNAAGTNRLCFKYPGIPDSVTAISATASEIPLEYRMIPVTYAEYCGQIRSKDMRANDTLSKFIAECREARNETKWADQEEPPAMQPEEYYRGMETGIY